MSGDRSVHGRTSHGGEIVRYDRAGKWYVEFPQGVRSPTTLARAARMACEHGGAYYLGVLGGRMFDAAVRKMVSPSASR